MIAALRALGGAGMRPAVELEAAMPERTLRRTLARLRALGRIVAHADRDEDNHNRTTYQLADRRTSKPRSSDDDDV